MKRLVLSACVLASAAPSHALSKIYSPDPCKWLNVTNTITLDSSVASNSSYGSYDYNHTNALDRTAFTAYLAIWSGYADIMFHDDYVMSQWRASDKFQIRDAALRRVYDYHYNDYRPWYAPYWDQFTFSGIMNQMRNFGGTYRTSSFFDTLYGTPQQFGFTSTVDLSKWTRMAAFCDLITTNSVFYGEYPASLYWLSMVSGVCFGEYGQGRTLPDDIRDFDDAWQSKKLPHRFEDVVGVAFGDDETILEITNTASSVLNRKPLAATSQTMSLRDAFFRDTNDCYLFYTNYVNTSYSFSGTADSDTFNVRINNDGSLTIVSPPSHASCGEIEGNVTTNTAVVEESVYNEPLRVSRCRASASSGGSSDTFVDFGTSIDTLYLLHYMNADRETNVVLVKSVNASVSGLSLDVNFFIHANDMPYTYDYGGNGSSSFSHLAGSVINVPTTARASSSYSISRGRYGTMDFTPSGDYLGWTYFLASYAVNTNPPPIDECIDFGYDGYSSKPSADMSHAAWSYAGFGPYYHSASSYKSIIRQKRQNIYSTLKEQETLAAKSSVGDFEDAESWLCYSCASEWVEEIDTFSASYSAVSYVVTQMISYVNGEYLPKTVSVSASAKILVGGSRSHGTDELRPSVGANAKVEGLTKQRIEPCAIRRQD